MTQTRNCQSRSKLFLRYQLTLNQRGLWFVDNAGLIYRDENKESVDFASVDMERSPDLSEELRFIIQAGLIYETKAPLISRQLVSEEKH